MSTVKEESTREESSILRWGGLAGISGGVLFIFVPVILFGFIPPGPSDPAGLVARFPDIRAVLSAGNALDLVVNVLVVALFLSLYQALRRTSPMAGLLGSVLGVLGLAVIFIENATQIAFDPLSNLYHASGTTATQQAAIVVAWQATQGMFNQFDTSATFLLSIAFIILGVAMLRSPAFGKILGWVSIVLGAATFVTVFIFGVASALAAIVAVPIFIILPILFGWKVYMLSKTA